MISVLEARQRILDALVPLSTEQVSIAAAHGRVLAQDITARVTKPPRDVSAMDGYAVRAADVCRIPATLKIVGEAAAGKASETHVGDGEAVRIFTGGLVPDGADTIVIQELTERDDDIIKVNQPVVRGRYIRKRGLDFHAGDCAGLKGRRMGPREIGLIAAMNASWIQVTRKPRIAILGTGDELVMPGNTPKPDQIVSSNSLVLASLVRECGGTPIDLGLARDDAKTLRAIIQSAHDCDMLVVTGGMSVGEHDLVRQVMADEGLDLDFWKIAMRPGKPLAFGMYGRVPMLGFPGNPVSTLVCGHIFLRPAISRMLGEDPASRHPVTETVVVGADLRENDEREDYLRARLEPTNDGARIAVPFARQDSSMMANLAQASCLIIRMPFAPPVRTGEMVDVVLL